MGAGADYDNVRVIWFDEKINDEENQNYFKQLKELFSNSKGYQSLDKGFENFYKNDKRNDDEFKIIFVIISGRLFGRYIRKIKDNINKIINIPYTYIFTSVNFKNILLNTEPDKDHILSYDTMISVNNGFYNPGGVFVHFNELLKEMKLIMKKLDSSFKIKPRVKDKSIIMKEFWLLNI